MLSEFALFWGSGRLVTPYPGLMEIGKWIYVIHEYAGIGRGAILAQAIWALLWSLLARSW